MGTLDLLKTVKDKVVDAETYQFLQRTYELQEENIRQKDRIIEMLERENKRLLLENEQLSQTNTELSDEISAERTEKEFVTSEGLAFKRLPDGTFDLTPYCPNCKIVIGSPKRMVFLCSACKYTKTTHMDSHAIARRLSDDDCEKK